MSSSDEARNNALLPKGLPNDAEAFWAANPTEITTTTKQTIKAGTTGKRLFITQAQAFNKTTTEDQILRLRHGTTDGPILHPADIADAHGDHGKMYNFDPPLVIPAGVDLDGIGVIANVGDCVVFVNGYIGT